MHKLLLVGAGGFIGSLLRYGVGEMIGRWRVGSNFPLATLLINVTGCLVLGLLAGWAESRGAFSPAARAFLFAGLLGGFTTFSAFGYETFQLVRNAQWQGAALSTGLQLVLGVTAVWAGFAMARLG